MYYQRSKTTTKAKKTRTWQRNADLTSTVVVEFWFCCTVGFFLTKFTKFCCFQR